MPDKLLEKYFTELKKEIDNQALIKELEESIEDINKEDLEQLIKKHN